MADLFDLESNGFEIDATGFELDLDATSFEIDFDLVPLNLDCLDYQPKDNGGSNEPV